MITAGPFDASLSVLAPARNEGPTFREHVVACMGTIGGLHTEIVVLDNQSTDGCCHGLPRDVLIVRTTHVEKPERLWLLGGSLAAGQSLLWVPRLLSYPPEQLHSLIVAAQKLGATAYQDQTQRYPPRLSFDAARHGPALLAAASRSRLERWRRTPIAGFLAPAVACHFLPLVIPLETAAPSIAANRAGASSGIRYTRGNNRLLSVIITAYNEGKEVVRTIESVRASARADHEIILVDDGSTDGSCEGLEALGVRVIRHPQRVGVACSRDVGTKAAAGEVFAFLDAHQRVGPGCLDRCAELAAINAAIACPPCRPLGRRYPVSYGSLFRLCPKRGFFSGEYRIRRPRQEVTRISGLRSPGYVIPRRTYERVGWISQLRGWGATDYSVALKAFFTDVDILHVNTNAIEHLFRKKIPYETNWQRVWRNHALIARVCFDDRTWNRYWLPQVFRANLTIDFLEEMDSPDVRAEHDRFMALKVRPDREFWRGLLRIHEPDVLGH